MFKISSLKPRLLVLCLTLLALSHAAVAAVPNAPEVYRSASSSVVIVTTWRSGVQLAQGSGVVVAPGKVVTNAHVIAQGESILIEGAGNETWQADWGYVDSRHDLAILTVSDLPLAPLEIAPTLPEIGATVFALGAPQGLGLTLSDGLVSAIRDTDSGTLIQMSVPISAGSSGGALLDGDGRLVGIPTMRALSGDSLNFAVPAARVEEVLTGAAQADAPGRSAAKPMPAAADDAPPLIGDRYYVVGANDNGIVLLDPQLLSVDGSMVTYTVVLRSRWNGEDGRSGYGREARFRSVLDCEKMQEAVLSVTRASYRDSAVIEATSRARGERSWTPVQSQGAGAYASLLCAAADSRDQLEAGLEALHAGLLPDVSSRFLRSDEFLESRAGEPELKSVAAWIEPDWTL